MQVKLKEVRACRQWSTTRSALQTGLPRAQRSGITTVKYRGYSVIDIRRMQLQAAMEHASKALAVTRNSGVIDWNCIALKA